jgi:hypothetical protein
VGTFWVGDRVGFDPPLVTDGEYVGVYDGERVGDKEMGAVEGVAVA